VVAVCLGPVLSIDLWLHLAVGRQIVTEQAIPTTDSFSHTAAGKPFVAHEWLSQVILYELYRLGGKGAMVALKLVLGLAAFGLLYLLAFRRSGEPLVAAGLVVLAALCARPYLDYRPTMFSLVFFAGLLLLLERLRSRPPRQVWWVPACVGCFALWMNLHGAAVSGIVLLAAVLAAEAVSWWVGVGERQEQGNLLPLLATGLPAAIAGACLNPRGWRALAYPLQLGTSQLALKNVNEWLSPDFQNWEMRAFEVLLLIGFGLLLVPRAQRRLSDIGLLVLFAHAALISKRHSVLFAWIAVGAYAGLAAGAAAELRVLLSGPHGRLAWASLGLAFALPCLACSWRLLPTEDVVATALGMRYLPAEATDFIEKERPAGKMFNLYEWGGYLMFFAPEIPVFVDGRGDVYEGPPFVDYMELWYGHPGWQERLAHYGVGFALLKPDSALRAALRESGQWREAHVDDVAVVVVRKQPPAEVE